MGRLPILKGTILFGFDSLPLILAVPSYGRSSGLLNKKREINFQRKVNFPNQVFFLVPDAEL